MKKIWGLHKIGSTSIQKEIAKLDMALSKLVRAYEKECITCGSRTAQMDCGHFRVRQNMSTRFHPLNVHAQCVKENRFQGGKTYEYGLALDKKYGKGTSLFLENLSRKICQWDLKQLQSLTAAAKIGMKVYEAVYYELKPEHIK